MSFYVYFLLIFNLILNISSQYSEEKNLTQKIEDMLKEQVPNLHIPSLSILVTDKNNTLYTKSFVKSENVDKPYVIASMSKSFTALGIMILNSKGKFSLNDTLDKITNYKGENLKDYFKNPSDLKEITIHQLLTHTAGVPTEADKGEGKIFKKYKGKFKYSNFGYGVLGRIIEIVSCLKYEEFIEVNILFELGMNKTTANHDKSIKNGLVDAYRNMFGFYFKSDIEKVSYTELHGIEIPAGGISSTVEDIGKYLRFMMREDDFLIPYSLKKLMIEEYIEARSEGEYYGYGWFNKKYDGVKVNFHSGSTYSFNSIMFFIPEKNIAVVGLINAYDVYTLDDQVTIKSDNIINIILGKDYKKFGSIYIIAHLFIDLFYLVLLTLLVLRNIQTVIAIYRAEELNYFKCTPSSIGIMIFDFIFIILVTVLSYMVPLRVLNTWKRTLQVAPEFFIFLVIAIYGTVIIVLRVVYIIFKKHFNCNRMNTTAQNDLMNLSINGNDLLS